MTGRGLARYKPLKSRTKRTKLLSSTSSITSLFDGLAASTSEAASPKDPGILSANESTKPAKMRAKSKSSTPLKERWLLTRKTWKYMADAGRRLIPEGMQNRGNNSEDLKKLEEYFQHVCRSEQKFLPWRRKQSYPGALAPPPLRRGSKRRTIARMFGRSKAASTTAVNTKSTPSPNTLSPPKISSAEDSEEEQQNATDENHRIYLIIRLLEKYLNLNESGRVLRSGQSFDSYVDSMDSNELEDYDSLRDFNTNSTTSPTYFAQDEDSGKARFKYDMQQEQPKSSSSTSPRSQPQSPPSTSTTQPRHTKQYPSTSAAQFQSFGWGLGPSTNNTSNLYDSLRNYTQSSRYPIPGIDKITPEMLKDKQLLRRIRDELKKQQIDKIYRRHGARPGFTASVNVPSTSSDYTSWPYKDLRSSAGLFKSRNLDTTRENRSGSPLQSNQSRNLDEDARQDSHIPLISIKYASQDKNLPANESGTQTDPIPIQKIYQLYNKYLEEQQQRHLLEQQQQDQQTITGLLAKSKSTSGVAEGTSKDSSKHSRRKSSIDNEDVSQSVSDTIKRYLRMARKKPTNENDANRFKRINYDTNLRNIRPKAEIPKPDDLDVNDRNKKIQTNEDWIDNVINEIKAFMSEKGREEYNLTHGLSESPLQSPPSTPTSPTRILQTTFKHLHRQSQGDQKSIDNKKDSKTNSNMQKSKSSSNIGQALSKKIWKSRSKSQTRPDSPVKSQWVPQGNGLWNSVNGKRVQINSLQLKELSDVERKSLQRVALDRINQLNMGMLVKPPAETFDTGQTKSTKRRAPLLLKRKALTTSFFDNKVKIDSNKNNLNNNGPIFGQPLEKSLSRDNTSLKAKSNTGSSGGSNKSGRSSRSSITSLQDSLLGGGGYGDNGRDDTHLGSCDSLFSKPDLHYITSGNDSSLSSLLFGQSDDCNNADDDDMLNNSQAPSGIQRTMQQQVPPLVLACIDHLSTHGLNVVGIFRVSTSKKRIRELREQLDSGDMTTFNSEISPHDVASLLKEYLRDLPEPLLTRSLYPAFLSTQRIRNRRLQLEALSHLIQLLPIAHRDTLYVLLKFLAQLARHSDDIINLATNTCRSVGNKMDSNNLATVIAPNILHCNSPGSVASDEEAEERLDVINVVRTMIDHYEELFIVPPDVMNDVYTVMMDQHPQQLDYLLERKECLSSRNNEQAELYDANDNEGDHLRRVYVREEFTHENSGKQIMNAQEDNIRRRSSRSKNQPQSSHDATRRQQDKKISSLVLSPVGDSNISIASISPPSTPSRKSMSSKGYPSAEDYNPAISYQISPRESNANEVLTASLKLPMQKITTINPALPVTATTTVTHTPGALNIGVDIPNIPYIEDSDSNSPTIYGSKPFADSGKTSKKAEETSPQTTPTRTSFPLLKKKSHYQPQYQSKVLTPYKALTQQKPTKTFHIFGEKSTNPSNSSGTAVEKSKSAMTLRDKFRTGSIDNTSVTTEPKFTASITNIGGDLLRSKTADFERLLKQQNKNTKIDEDSSEKSHNAGSLDNQLSKSNSSKHNSNSRSIAKDPIARLGPIYKRHDVISSATNTKK